MPEHQRCYFFKWHFSTSTQLVLAVWEYSDVTPLWYHSANDPVFRCVYLTMILKGKCLFSVYQLCLDEEGFNPPSWLCCGWSSAIAAVWKVLMEFPLGWGQSQHYCLSSAWVSLEMPVLGEQTFLWVAQTPPRSSGLHSVLRGVWQVEWHNTTPITCNHRDFG